MSFLIAIMGWGARAILVLLLSLSVWSVGIMLDRRKRLREIDPEQANRVRELIEAAKWDELSSWSRNTRGFYPAVVRGITTVDSNQPELIDRAAKEAVNRQRPEFEKGLTVLATLGSNAPFVGLFGTVLGIIEAFGVLSTGAAGTSSIMGALAEALIATAIGLFVAIPAVVAYNFFSRQLKTAFLEVESLRDLYITRRASPST